MKKSAEYAALGGLVVLSLGVAAVGSGWVIGGERKPDLNPANSPLADKAINESVLTATPYSEVLRQITPAEAAVMATATTTALIRQAEASATATATRVPSPTTEPTKIPPTPTTARATVAAVAPTMVPTEPAVRETVVAKTEKSPLPRYGVFMGSFLNDQGVIVIASIPETDNQDSILLYLLLRDKDGSTGGTLNREKAADIVGNTFSINPMGTYRVKATLDSTGKVLTGRIQYGPVGKNGPLGKPILWESDFQAQYAGSGKTDITNSMKRARVIGFHLGYVPDLSVVNLNKFEIDELSTLPSQ